TTTTMTTNTQTSSSPSSSNSSSPIKIQQHLPSCLQDSILPLRDLDNSTNDLMPKWAQDCFYRTVVLGLKPLLLQDIPSSPLKHSTSTSSIESSDSLETTSELLNNQKQIKVRRSISISDYKQIETKTNKEKYQERKLFIYTVALKIDQSPCCSNISRCFQHIES
ncbi:unnamed protein product, partial [Rotaria sp. Silwood1]